MVLYYGLPPMASNFVLRPRPPLVTYADYSSTFLLTDLTMSDQALQDGADGSGSYGNRSRNRTGAVEPPSP